MYALSGSAYVLLFSLFYLMSLSFVFFFVCTKRILVRLDFAHISLFSLLQMVFVFVESMSLIWEKWNGKKVTHLRDSMMTVNLLICIWSCNTKNTTQFQGGHFCQCGNLLFLLFFCPNKCVFFMLILWLVRRITATLKASHEHTHYTTALQANG